MTLVPIPPALGSLDLQKKLRNSENMDQVRVLYFQDVWSSLERVLQRNGKTLPLLPLDLQEVDAALGRSST